MPLAQVIVSDQLFLDAFYLEKEMIFNYLLYQILSTLILDRIKNKNIFMAQEKKQSQDIAVYVHTYMCMQSTPLGDKDIKVGGSDFKV